MKKVHILPSEIVSKIAAGEVIERPASVIKELMENAFDAGTKSIELQVQQAGKTLIRLKDTGSGISGEDIEKIFNRHATSKIEKIDDLYHIRSLGFRGEALYSIAAIADVILRSKRQAEDNGWEIHLRGGKRLSLKPASIPVGTEVEVKELFFNTPARRKFLKSNTTEINQILNVFIPYCLLYPQIRFYLGHQERVLVDLASTRDHRQRLAEVLNLEPGYILEARHNQPERDLSVTLFLGDINITRSRRDMQYIFVNGRPVQNKSISYHLNDVYRLILPPHSFPFFAVFIDIPPENIDVNIHPTKREVKIRDEQDICSLLRRITEKTLMEKGDAKTVQDSYDREKKAKTVQINVIEKSIKDAFGHELPLRSEPLESDAKTGGSRFATEQYSFPQADAAGALQSHAPLFAEQTGTLRGKLKNGRFIGNFINKYLLFETTQTLLIIDQHAAQERITFEILIRQMGQGKIQAQQLLSPYLLRLSPQELNTWAEAKARLEEIGFATTQFDEETIAIHTYPVLIRDPQKAVRDILSGSDAARCDHETLARRACRASIMAGDPLNTEQVEHMRHELLNCRDPFTCPHGRPTVIEMKEEFLNKQFLR